MKKFMTQMLCGVAISAAATQVMANARDHIMVVGSSTVYPFSKVVAERYSLKTGDKAPKVEPTGTGGGFKEFCKGIGIQTPDIANASRRIKQSEYDACQKSGVTDIIEVLIGYDGIVIANSIKAEPMALTRKDLFLALAKVVPNPKKPGQLIDNPYKTWKDVNSSLPATPISVMGPPPTSGTRDAFAELALEGGCKKFDFIAAMKKTDKDKYKAVCHGVREDGPYVEMGENDNLIVRKLNDNPTALGVFGFSFLDQNADKVRAATVDGEQPTFDTIADGSYPVSRPLYFYVKKAHVNLVPGIAEYLKEFTSRGAWGDEGYLTEKGMIPLDRAERKKIGGRVKNMEPLKL